MKNEPDKMRIDSPRLHALLLANRVTLVIIGIVWIGMIIYRLAGGEYWRFLASTVPMIILIWHGTYLFFKRHEVVVSRTSSGGNANRVAKTAGAIADRTRCPSEQRGQPNLPLPLPF
ncbi:MAG: hypothetical protein JSW58_03860 [Candidatus Latescibacterota bacterium]|nr:MAG: hypothetical protein JSW58_03860 [Candidatus Latescibacterota bacterium]